MRNKEGLLDYESNEGEKKRETKVGITMASKAVHILIPRNREYVTWQGVVCNGIKALIIWS